jgi:hypothetical protein
MAHRTKNTTEHNTEMVARRVNELLIELHREAGIPLAEVMAGAHSQVVVMLASILGGELAAERCISAAETVRPVLSIQDALLFAAEPSGHA